MTSMSDLDLSEEDIACKLLKKEQSEPNLNSSTDYFPEPPRHAAVLIPLIHATIQETTGWHILLTRRTDTLPEHSGQVAFPGGQVHPDDPSLEITALRETQEEIGLDPNTVHILGRLDRFLTITNYLVTPIVGSIQWPTDLNLAPAEVSRIFTIPLDWLSEPAHYTIRERILPPAFAQRIGTTAVPVVYFDPYDGEVLWGVSAAITLNLLSTLLEINISGRLLTI